jgi:hypothetical protein
MKNGRAQLGPPKSFVEFRWLRGAMRASQEVEARSSTVNDNPGALGRSIAEASWMSVRTSIDLRTHE